MLFSTYLFRLFHGHIVVRGHHLPELGSPLELTLKLERHVYTCLSVKYQALISVRDRGIRALKRNYAYYNQALMINLK